MRRQGASRSVCPLVLWVWPSGGLGSNLHEERIDQIVLGPDVLVHSPLIGRKLRGDLREWVIGKAARGHVALYRYVPTLDTVFVLAIRGQRESGY